MRVFWWRALHLALLAVPALKALFGRTCFLTLWQAMLEQEVGARASQEPLIARLVESVIFWPLPILAGYLAFAQPSYRLRVPLAPMLTTSSAASFDRAL